MLPIQQWLEKYLDRASVFAQDLLVHSRADANRRTVVILCIAAGVIFFSYLFFIRAPNAFPLGRLVEISEGVPLSEIAGELKEQKVVRSTLLLRASVFVLGHERSVQFGDYLFNKSRNVFSVARAISLGAHGLEPTRVRVPEGATVEEIAVLFTSHFQRFDEERFMRAAENEEGYLFPDTYFFLPNANDDLVLRTLQQNFNTNVATIRPQIEAFGKPFNEVMIMASILEREAHTSEDRRKIAGVLWERLDRGMLLQVDATFLYSLGRTTFDLTIDDLESRDDPYNTYVHKGLPPTPIGSPSLDSILAAVTPINEGYLFYLADKNNVTHYSKTYEEHLKKKRLYLGG